MALPELKLDALGLITVVAQDARSGEVRMVAHADREALDATLATGEAHFHSRSRGRLWKKGEESGNVLAVREVWIDCDADAVLYLVVPAGPTCHTGAPSCFFRPLPFAGREPVDEAKTATEGRALPLLAKLEAELATRTSADAGRSYTKSLLDEGAPKIGAKLREEAGELAEALDDESDERVASEAADVVYHLLVGLLHRGLPLTAVEEVLAARFGVSGHDEKASRE